MVLSSKTDARGCLLPQMKLSQRSASGGTVISKNAVNRTDETFFPKLITLPKIRSSTNETQRN
jgi:hypothetical protein